MQKQTSCYNDDVTLRPAVDVFAGFIQERMEWELPQ